MKSLFKTLSLAVCFFMAASINALAGGGSTRYYTKVSATATPVGAGTVYVSASNSAPAADAYQETVLASNNGTNRSMNYYLFANPVKGYKLGGWYSDAECTTPVTTTRNGDAYTYSVQAGTNATSEAAAAAFSVYAQFVEATEFYSSTVSAHIVGGTGCSVSVATEAGSTEFAETMTASVIGDVDAEHTYYLQAKADEDNVYRFVGWYADEACKTLLSNRATYTYKVTATSLDDSNPTAFDVYAKYETIPYFYSQVEAVSVGNGEALIATKRAGEYAATATQKVADNAKHTYYLTASYDPEAKMEFDGWYADEACTELLSRSVAYTMSVTSESNDVAAPTVGKVYGKFVTTNVYQLRNSGFEVWETVDDGEEPINWSSFLTASGNMASMVKNAQLKKNSEDVHSGEYSARLNARSVMGIAMAQGNMTTGCINGGSMTATDANGNYNWTNPDDPRQAMYFPGHPDAMKVWIKSNTSGAIKIAAHLHEKGYFQDPIEGNVSKQVPLVASAVAAPESNDGVWTEYTVPFEYASDSDPYYALVSFATSNVPGQGKASDVMFIDDVFMVYNSELTSATYNDKAVTFRDGHASVVDYYDPELFSCTTNGRGATYETAYDKQSGILTVTVKGEDIEFNPDNCHNYTIQFIAYNGNGWRGDYTFPEAQEIDDLLTFELTFEEASSLEVGPSAPLGAIYDENGNPYALFFGETFGSTIVRGNKAVITFEKIADINAAYQPQIEKVLAKVGAFLGGTDASARVVICGKSFTVDGEYYNDLISTSYTFAQGVVTGIDAALDLQSQRSAYDLSGRRVSAPTKGMIIVGGKKVIR